MTPSARVPTWGGPGVCLGRGERFRRRVVYARVGPPYGPGVTKLEPSLHEERCPHCGVAERYRRPTRAFSILDGSHTNGEPTCRQALVVTECRECRKAVVDLLGWTSYVPRERWELPESVQRLCPRRTARPPVPVEVSASVREWYEEAASAEPASVRASVSFARVCLQLALRDRGLDGRSLLEQIERARVDARVSGSLLAEKLRIVGELSCGELDPDSLEIEQLDVLFATLQELFNTLYVVPERHAELARRIMDKVELRS